jgi:hypothetical protein
LAHGFGRDWQPRGIDLPFAVIGAEVLLALTVWQGWGSRYMLTLIVLGGQAGAVVLGMQSDWARYHLPVLLIVVTCIGLLGGQIWSLANRPAVMAFLRDRLYGGLDRLIPGEPASLARTPNQIRAPDAPGARWNRASVARRTAWARGERLLSR